jgi:hypothetical protein
VCSAKRAQASEKKPTSDSGTRPFREPERAAAVPISAARLKAPREPYFALPWLATAFIAAAMASWSPR